MGSALPRPEGLLKMEYVPREQFVPFHKRKQRHSVLVTHRRCGKTVASICDLIGKAIKHPPARQGYEGGPSPTSPRHTPLEKTLRGKC